MNNPYGLDLNWYCEQFGCDNTAMTLKKDGSYVIRKKGESKWACVAHLKHIGLIVGGDIRITDNGVIAPGYDLEWFGNTPLNAPYMAEKFLKPRWNDRKAKRIWFDEIERLKKEGFNMAENFTWTVCGVPFYGTVEEVIQFFLKTCSFISFQVMEKEFPRYSGKDGYMRSFMVPEYWNWTDYDDDEIGWLFAVQRAFMFHKMNGFGVEYD